MFDGSMTDKINAKFHWIDDVPAAVTIADAETLEVIKYNQRFSDLFSQPSLGGMKANLNGIDASDGAKSVATLTVGGVTARLFTNVKLFQIGGKCVLLATHENLLNLIAPDCGSDGVYTRKGGLDALEKQLCLSKTPSAEGARFTLVYFRITIVGGDLDATDALANAVAIVKSGTRQTDILAAMDKRAYILIFPKCAYEVAESIMETIEKKFEVFNETADAGYGIAIQYMITECNASTQQTPEGLVSELKKELD